MTNPQQGADVIAEARRRLAEITQGTWAVHDDEEGDLRVFLDDGLPGMAVLASVEEQSEAVANAEFIAAAPRLIAALLDLVTRQPQEGWRKVDGQDYEQCSECGATYRESHGKPRSHRFDCRFAASAIRQQEGEEVKRLKSAIRWALGEEGEFSEEPEPLAGKHRRRFWWRKELRERAFGANDTTKPPAGQQEGEKVSSQVTRALSRLVQGIRMLRVLPSEDANAPAMNRAVSEAAAYVASFIGREVHLIGEPCKACGGVGRGCEQCSGEGSVIASSAASRGVCSTCGHVDIVWRGHPTCGECGGSKVIVDPPPPAGQQEGEQAKYQELLLAVARKHPNETRHETALRYIREAESRGCGGPVSSSPAASGLHQEKNEK